MAGELQNAQYEYTEIDLMVQRVIWYICFVLMTIIIIKFSFQIKQQKTLNKCTKYGTLISFILAWVSITAILISDVCFYFFYFFFVFFKPPILCRLFFQSQKY